jgi:glycosyltransferase involved in cell wall biosynthesis
MIEMKRIAWLTPYPFIDVDLPIVVELQKEMEIYWQILVGKLNDDTKNYVVSHLINTNNIKYEFVQAPYRVYDLRLLGIYRKLLKQAKAYKPDLYYTSVNTAPFGPLLYKWSWPMKRVVTACHNVSTPKGANREYYARFYTGWTLRLFNNIQVFSASQRDILLRRFPDKNVLLAPLAIKDYGEPSLPAKNFDEKMIIFLFFGIISPYKRLDLLIDAAQNIYEKGYKNFKVKIAGKCKTWSQYAALIKYPQLFDNRIEFIPNSDVANIFVGSDYFVMPYQDIAQSGAITVAYRYNLPIILSDLPQFRPYGYNEKTCLFFESGNVRDLESKMIAVINGGKQMHSSLKIGLSGFVKNNYSTPAIAKKYIVYFEDLLKKESLRNA